MTRMEYKILTLFLVNAIRLCLCSKNVLLIVVDDLSTSALSTYVGSEPVVYTPNMALLAAQSWQMNAAYSQQAICGPSRTSFLTSRYPDTTKVHDQHGYWRQKGGNFTSLPQYFKEHGYKTLSVGKVFHPGHGDDQPFSWSQEPFHPSTQKHKNDPVCPPDFKSNILCPVDVSRQPETTLPDIQSKDRAIQYLKQFGDQEKFFMAVGFHKPHIPLKFPREYLHLYPLDLVKEAENPDKPQLLPDIAWNPWTDVRSREDVANLSLSFPFGRMPRSFSRRIRQHYYAATSYVDDLIGEVLEAVPDGTLVSLVSDHGWSLGEHQEWSKYSNYETASRVPWIITESLKSFKRTNVMKSHCCPDELALILTLSI